MSEISPIVSLSPPWYILRNQLFYTLGQTPGVIVSELIEGTPYKIRIDVTTCLKQATAIRLVVPEQYNFGEVAVMTEVYFYNTLVPMPTQAISTVEEVITILTDAFWCNTLVMGIINVDGKLPPMSQNLIGSAVVVICPHVIQFFNDDLSNLCNNYIEVASKVFTEIFNLKYGELPLTISFTTYDEKCMKGSPIEPVCFC